MELHNIAGLKARRKVDREKIFAAFKAVADSYGIALERRDEEAHGGWSGAGIVISGEIRGVGFLLDIDDLHERQGMEGGLLSWYNAGIGRARDFSSAFMVAVKEYGRRHHKASSVGDWHELLEQFAKALEVAEAGNAFEKLPA